MSWTGFFQIFECHIQIRYMAKTASYTNIRLLMTTLIITSGVILFIGISEDYIEAEKAVARRNIDCLQLLIKPF